MEDKFMIPANVFFYSQSYKGSEVRYKYYSDLASAIADGNKDTVVISFDKEEQVPTQAYAVRSQSNHVKVYFTGKSRTPQLLFNVVLQGAGVDLPLALKEVAVDPYGLTSGMIVEAVTSGNDGVYGWSLSQTNQDKVFDIFGHNSCYAVATPCEDDGFGGGTYMFGSKGNQGSPNSIAKYAPSGSILVYDIVAGVSTPAWLPLGVTCQLAVFICPI